jgi:L-seryl-tRNA(Ser) seleniumtransferase
MARALRLDKMTLAALEVTLRAYLDPEKMLREIPTLRMLTLDAEEVASRARVLADRISAAAPSAVVDTMPDVSRAGGGALPMADIPTTVVSVEPRSIGVVDLEAQLRLGQPAVIARIKDDRLLLDPRTLSADDTDVVVARVAAICGEG